MSKDMKESLGAVSKPRIDHTTMVTMVYEARAKEYGSDKYERANYQRGSYDESDTAENVERVRQYLRGTIGHLVKCLNSIEAHQADDYRFDDVEATRRAVFAPDTEAGLSFPASNLPHLAHGLASFSMALRIAELAGLLPSDPGTPWRDAHERFDLTDVETGPISDFLDTARADVDGGRYADDQSAPLAGHPAITARYKNR